MKTWHRYAELRPDQLAEVLNETPIAFWPLGLLEHHGWHMPVGYDGLKAEQICIRLAEQTGGLLLPVMWWGSGGGHGEFIWTHYQPEAASEAILSQTTHQLLKFGFRVMVILAGHYPWQPLLDRALPPIRGAYPDKLLIWGTEATIGGEVLPLPGDHAAREETSYGLHLFPDLIDIDALEASHQPPIWPEDQPPEEAGRHPGVDFEPDSPRFAQFGEDARGASAERGEAALTQLIAHLTNQINQYLAK